MMESSGVRVKDEPVDESLSENVWNTINEIPVLKNFQLSPFPIENSTHNLRKCDEMKIVFECEDVKPKVNLSVVKKIDNNSPDQLWNIKDCDSYELQNIIKTETMSEVKDGIFNGSAHELNSNFNCEPGVDKEIIFECQDVKPSWDISTVKKMDDDSKNHLRDDIHGETFSPNSNLEKAIDSLHKKITYACDKCKKVFYTNNGLRRHIESAHDGDAYSCDLCEKKCSTMCYLKNRIDVVHNGVKHACDICGKLFSQKKNLKTHIDSKHIGIRHACDIYGKSFSYKCTLKSHVDSVHNRITHLCETCGRVFSRKSGLKIHIDSVHNGITHTCGVCGATLKRKKYLKLHINSMHRSGITTQ